MIFNSVKVMQHAIVAAKRQCVEPDVYIAPRIVDIRARAFYSAEAVFEQARPARDELKQRLERLLSDT
jgi:hypothetical protein